MCVLVLLFYVESSTRYVPLCNVAGMELRFCFEDIEYGVVCNEQLSYAIESCVCITNSTFITVYIISYVSSCGTDFR